MTKRQMKKLQQEYRSLKELSDFQKGIIDGLYRDMNTLSNHVNGYQAMLLRLPLLSIWKTFKDQGDGTYVIYWKDSANVPHCRLVDKRGGKVYLNERDELFPLDKIKPEAYLKIPSFPQFKKRK